MTGRPSDDELRAMLQALPRPEPPSGFAEGVMARVRADARHRGLRPWLLAAAAAAVVASGLVIRSVRDGSGTEPPRVAAAPAADVRAADVSEIRDPDHREFAAIVEEYRQLAEEVEALRRLGGESPYGPLIRVGGNEELELFLDLESYLNRPPRPAASLVVPAADRRPRR